MTGLSHLRKVFPHPGITSSVLLMCIFYQTSISKAEEIKAPRSLDDRLTIELFASEPDIVTVTGLTVDQQNRIYVVESHTHFRPENYEGPETDRIRLLEDTTGDGKADRIQTFYAGSTETMNVGAHPDGWLYVATRSSIFRLRDKDDDGKADIRQNLVQLETKATYPHNGFSGFAFDFFNNLYFSMGENEGVDAELIGDFGNVYFTLGQNYGDDATLISKGNKRLSALRGEGGIFRCRTDGSQLERVATGFWNPFHLCFDVYGRMFVGDNDPGNRPPCRLLTIVEGGDYGYRRRTLEPFIAINAETPGTLPMTSSTGESPTGLISYESDHLPEDYRGSLLVASWGEHRIDRYDFIPEGANFKTTTQPVIAGEEHFRPAGIAVGPDGSLYVGDWADRSYPLHGKGRVWRIRALNPPQRSQTESISSKDWQKRDAAARKLLAQGKKGISKLTTALKNSDSRVKAVALNALISTEKMTPEFAASVMKDKHVGLREQGVTKLPSHLVDFQKIATSDASPAVQAAALRRIKEKSALPILVEYLKSTDLFMQQAARQGLRQTFSDKELSQLFLHKTPEVRLAVILLLKESASPPDASLLKQALNDENLQVRFVAVEWIGRDELKQFRETLIKELAKKATTPELLKAYLASISQLEGVMKEWTRGTTGDWWVKKSKSQEYAAQLLDLPETSPEVIQQILLFLPASHPALNEKKLDQLLKSDYSGVQTEAVRKMREIKTESAREKLLQLALNSNAEANLRAEAIIGLDPSQPQNVTPLLQLANDGNPTVSKEALRTLTGATLTEQQQTTLKELATADAQKATLIERVLKRKSKQQKPAKDQLAKWMQVLSGPADSQAGQRLFFHPKGPGCFRCHQIDGRGQQVGPGLIRMQGRIALNRERLVEAIINPSKDIDPGFLPLTIVTIDGQTASGIYHKHNNKERSIYDSNGKILSFKISDIEEMIPSKTSIMPNGLVDQMTLQEFRDLIAYLLPEDQQNPSSD
ncbi:PVC-type heme-binding CxxCH protein [Gimesia aquarii]|uniref:HEAT repeat protein n=1 Tax=Gimesia aquarii TaxID=2527964 RepID=A0A517W0W6_9PLAN|nr:PVC-type heme-binding CxxCH protein [Gimesia aquarii]QDT98901.1 HEAT repeat protein [Gimesia aquarii]